MAIRNLRGASFALVLCGEERGPSAEAGDILVVQVVIAIIFEKSDRLRFYLYIVGQCCEPAGMNRVVAVWGVDAIIAAAGWFCCC
jgi:hypothetical protein